MYTIYYKLKNRFKMTNNINTTNSSKNNNTKKQNFIQRLIRRRASTANNTAETNIQTSHTEKPSKNSELIEVTSQPNPKHPIRNDDWDTSVYQTDQLYFKNQSAMFIDELTQNIGNEGSSPKEFNEILTFIKDKRNTFQNQNATEIQIRDAYFFHTHLCSYYKDRTVDMYKNINAEQDKLIDIDNAYKHIDMFKDNKYKKFIPVYQKNPTIPLTTTYSSYGKMLPKTAIKACNIEYAAIITFKNSNIMEDANQSLLNEEIKKNAADFTKLFEKYQKHQKHQDSIENKEELERPYVNNEGENGFIKKDDGTIIDTALMHVVGIKVQTNLDEINKEYQDYIKNKKNKEEPKVFENICNVVYLFAHTCPLSRGTAWGAEVIASAFFRDLFKDNKFNFIKSDLDFQCFSQSSDKFIDYMKNKLKLDTDQKKSILSDAELNAQGLYCC
jgi:hypothetical protein